MQSLPRHARCTAIFAFDVLHIDANDHRGLPLVVREAALSQVLRQCLRVRCVHHAEEQGEALFAEVDEMGLDGIVANALGDRLRDPQSIACGWPCRAVYDLTIMQQDFLWRLQPDILGD